MPRSAATGPRCPTAPSRRATKTAGPGEPAPDFRIQGPRTHGVAGLVHLFGIESPGLTASLALADAAVEELS